MCAQQEELLKSATFRIFEGGGEVKLAHPHAINDLEHVGHKLVRDLTAEDWHEIGLEIFDLEVRGKVLSRVAYYRHLWEQQRSLASYKLWLWRTAYVSFIIFAGWVLLQLIAK